MATTDGSGDMSRWPISDVVRFDGAGACPELSEQQICDWVYRQVRAGERRFDSGEVCPYPANTLRYTLDVLGWCYGDQRRAHMRHNPAYRAEQERIEKAMMENGK